MKKLLIILGAVVAIFIAIIVLMNKSEEVVKEENSDILDKYGDYEVTASTIDILSNENYQNIVSEKEAKEISESEGYLYFFSPECLHCTQFTPILMPYAKEKNIEINQYNILVFENGWNEYQITGTPTLIYFKDGKEVDRIVGGTDVQGLDLFFKSTGAIE